MIGDSTHDIDAGTNAGAWSIGVLTGVGDVDVLSSSDYLLSSVSELPLMLDMKMGMFQEG